MMGGLSHFHIDAIGNVNPCVFLPVTFGNILHEDFETIYRRMRKAIPRPLHKECPSLELAERLQNCYRERGSMPVPYEMVQGDWGVMYSSDS
jgi:MoaA/NifB/PqqE/SkfB family radical SAM enzyme